MAKQKISEDRKPDAMPQEEWDRLRVTLSAAEKKSRGITVEMEVEVPDPDPDALTVQRIREKSLKSALSAQDIADHNAAEIRLKAKGLL